MTPAQSLETTELAIGGDPFTTRFDRHRREIGIGHEVALGATLCAKSPEQVPVAQAGFDADTVGLIPQLFGKGSLSAVHVQFPDPWWKRAHQKRAVVQPDFSRFSPDNAKYPRKRCAANNRSLG